MRLRNLCCLTLLSLALSGCTEDFDPNADLGDETSETGDSSGDGDGDGDSGSSGDGDGESSVCECDVSNVCDEACECDDACSVDTDNPPLRDGAKLLDRSELVLMYPSTAGGSLDKLTIYDDTWQPDPEELKEKPGMHPAEAPLGELTTSNLMQYPFEPDTLAFDVDLDGRDEVLVAGPNAVFALGLDPESGTQQTDVVLPYPAADRAVLASGDIDDDGTPELAVGRLSGGALTWGIYRVENGQAELIDEGVRSSIETPLADADIAFGNIDAEDPGDELVVAWSETNGYLLWQAFGIDQEMDTTVAGPPMAMDLNRDSRLHLIDLELGDMDGDGLDEAIVADLVPEGTGARLIAWHSDAPAAGTANLAGTESVSSGSMTRPSIAMVDMGTVEESGSSLLPDGRVEAVMPFVNRTQNDRLGIMLVGAGSTVFAERFSGDLGRGTDPRICAADTDLDRAPELVLTARPLHETFSGDEHGTARVDLLEPDYSNGWTADRAVQFVTSNDFDLSKSALPAIPTLADVDGDGLRVRATGDVVRLNGRVHITSVLAAPPTWFGHEEVPQQATSYTAFGNEISNSTTESEQIGMTAGVTMTTGGSFLDIISFEAKASFQAEVSRTLSETKSEVRGTEEIVGPEEHAVVFRTTPYASHSYEIVAHPDETLIGTEMTVDVPGEPTSEAWPLSRFLDAYGTDSLPLELLAQEIGDPHTYKTGSTCNAGTLEEMVGKEDVILELHKGQKMDISNLQSGSRSSSITLEELHGVAEEVRLGVELEVGAEAANNGGAVSAGVFGASTHEVVVGKSVTFRGEIAGIYDETDEWDYSWGLCVYTYADEDQQVNYPIIDYWVN